MHFQNLLVIVLPLYAVLLSVVAALVVNNLTVMADRQNATISNVASVRTTLHAVQIRIASRIERRMEIAPQQNPLPMCQQ